MARLHGFGPSEAARAKRVASSIAVAARTAMPLGQVQGIDALVRGIALHLKSHRFKLQHLDSDNGAHAITAVVTAFPVTYFRQLGGDNRELGRLWNWMTQRAQHELRNRYMYDHAAQYTRWCP